MRLRFSETPWDLYAVIGYSVGVAAGLTVLRVVDSIAILLVFFVPGYVLVAAFFPNAGEIDWIERLVLSFGLSIAIVALLELLLSFAPWGVPFDPIAITSLVFTVGVGCAAYWRRMRVPAEGRLALTLNLAFPLWKKSIFDKGLTIAFVASTVVAAGTLVYVVTQPQPGERFTEFYILGPGGNASGYPSNLTVNERGSVILGIVNHEAAAVNYTVRVDLVGVRSVYNSSTGFSTTVEVNRTIWSWFNATLKDGADWTRLYTFSIPAAGLWKVHFFLFRDGALAFAYRELWRYITVS